MDHIASIEDCRLFGDARRPGLCDAFSADPAICGDSREEALAALERLEVLSLPGVS